jgi:hypothetical protein
MQRAEVGVGRRFGLLDKRNRHDAYQRFPIGSINSTLEETALPDGKWSRLKSIVYEQAGVSSFDEPCRNADTPIAGVNCTTTREQQHTKAPTIKCCVEWLVVARVTTAHQNVDFVCIKRIQLCCCCWFDESSQFDEEIRAEQTFVVTHSRTRSV